MPEKLLDRDKDRNFGLIHFCFILLMSIFFFCELNTIGRVVMLFSVVVFENLIDQIWLYQLSTWSA